MCIWVPHYYTVWWALTFEPRSLAQAVSSCIHAPPPPFLATVFSFFCSHCVRQVCKIIGFAPSLLQIVVRDDLALPVRQATVVYLKNFISENWLDKDDESNPNQLEFAIHEQDREAIRNRIVEDLIKAPDLVQIQLGTCVYHIIKADFPGRWPQIVLKIRDILAQSRAFDSCTGAILCLYKLVKNYEYKKAGDRGPLDEAMNVLLPMMYQLMGELMDPSREQTANVVLLQKNILKIYYTLIQVRARVASTIQKQNSPTKMPNKLTQQKKTPKKSVLGAVFF